MENELQERLDMLERNLFRLMSMVSYLCVKEGLTNDEASELAVNADAAWRERT